MRFQVNDSYMAYTNDKVTETSTDNIVLKNGIYAVMKRNIEDLKGEFQVNTRTEWRVIYVDPFSVNIAREQSYSPSPLPIFKRRLSVSRLTRLTGANPFELETEAHSADALNVKKERLQGNKPLRLNPMVTIEDESGLPEDNSSFFGGIGGIPKHEQELQDTTDPFADVLSERTGYREQNQFGKQAINSIMSAQNYDSIIEKVNALAEDDDTKNGLPEICE